MNNLFDNLLVSSPNEGGLFFIHEGESFKLDNFDTTGLSVEGRKVLRGIQPSELYLYDLEFREITQSSMAFDDIHDVCFDDFFCYLVGTSGNEIVKLNSAGEEIQRWVFPGEKDSLHINCLGIWAGKIVFSAFGEFQEHRGYKGKTEKSGFVQDLNTGHRLITGLSQPHSLISLGQNLLLANSEKQELLEYSPSGDLVRSIPLDGYTRGIYIFKDIIYVGLSCSRNIECSGISTATVVALDRNSWVEQGRFQLPTNEIYAIQGFANRDDAIHVLANITSKSSSKLMATVADKNGQITSLNQTLADRDGKIVKLGQTVAERDSQIASLGQAVSELSEQIANLDQTVAERDSQVASLNQVIAEREGQISNLNQIVAERESQIADLNQAVAERDSRAARLKQAVSQQDGLIAGLNQALAERDRQIAGLNQTVSDRESQIARLSQTLVGRDIEIAALRSSNSWRVTKPLRLTSLLLKGQYKELLAFETETVKQLDSPETRSDFALTQSHQKPAQRLHELPNGFDQDLYLKLNPDLAKAGVDPVTHYLLHGRYEGRICSLPDIDIQAIRDFNADLDTILVVSHEASRTGAPILSLNLVQTLVESYNVVALLLGGGPLSDAFQQSGAAVMTASNLKRNTVLANLIVRQLCDRYNFKFALVNSIESRVVLPALGNCFIPTVSLLHEFASYTRPRHAFREALFWSGETVFSANVTMENAFAEYPDLGERYAHILPQGRCRVPLEEYSEEQLQAERTRIRRLIRPKGIAENSMVVLGAGYVQIRKGVDLFIECAAHVVRAPEGRKCRFVWIGKGYDPDNDVGYSVYLADQIRRAGLEEHVFFINETTAIETAYEEADLLLLSSRLDPLPNVAIDAMAHGMPVLCFNKTTGIADFLIESGLKNHCVAEYLDSVDLAGKILALAGSQELYEDVAGRCREASIAYFSMKKYVARLEALAQDICVHTKQEKADTQEILASGLFRRDFSCPPHWNNDAIEADVRAYVRAWSSGIDRRKPLPGFDPGVYQEQHGLATDGADPFADYLRAGQPDGPWNYPVIVTSDTMEADLPDNQRVALHLHVYYPELLPEITARLSHNRISPDLFISVANEEARDLVAEELKDYRGDVVDIQIVPGRGRDIGPFLTAFGQRISTYDFVGHIHTKKSADVKDASVGKIWYRFLLENLLGGESGAMADSILAKMNGDASIGMVFPDDPNIIGWNDNRAIAETIAERIGLDKLPEHFIFPIGTMFWAKTSALAPLMNLKLDWDDYPEEPLPYDGTLLHALERLFSLSLSVSNLRSAVTNVIGLTR